MKRLIPLLFLTTLLAMPPGSNNVRTRGSERGSAYAPPVRTAQTAAASNYVLIAWTELGMHCIDGKDYSVFSVLPPYNVIHAQLFKKAEPPVPITSGVTITYQAMKDTTGSFNSSSAKKTNFWNYVTKLFLTSPLPETGLAGYQTQSKIPQPMAFNTLEGYWEAVGIPTVPYDDLGKFNPYPMAQLVAKNTAGQTLATATVVLSVSDEMSCKDCHASNSDAAAMPQSGWVNNPNPAKDVKLNILMKHDDRFNISGYLGQLQTAGYTYKSTLYGTAISGTPVLCAACHSDNALGMLGLTGIKSLSSDMHTLHGPQVYLPTGHTLDTATDDLTSCYLCHPGPTTLCKRGAMNTQKCSDCHGVVSHVGDPTRNAWYIEPACQMCHNSSTRYLTAFGTNGQWRQTTDTTFATNSNVPITGANLFRFSMGHGSVFCSGCHGSPHAEYPTLQANDNQYSINLQGYAAKLTECTVCHTANLTNTANGGPHGIHLVGQAWVTGHGDWVNSNGYQSCAYCHGSTYKGLALSINKVQRTFTLDNGQKKTFAVGHQFGCYDCHNGPNGG
jgi:hypothetical protein